MEEKGSDGDGDGAAKESAKDDEDALKAFEVHALDYLLKPFDQQRFDNAVARSRDQKDGDQTNRRIDELVRELKSKPLTRLCVRDQGRIHFVELSEILWLESAGNYVEIHTGGRSHLMRETMASLEGRLSSRQFFRVSRSAVVNRDAVVEVNTNSKSEHFLLLRGGREKIKSSLALNELMAWLEA